MILFLSDWREDYQDPIFYAFKKTYGEEVVIWPDKPNYFEPTQNYLNCHYNLTRTPATKEDIWAANKINNIKAIFVISSGYAIGEQWDLAKALKRERPSIPIIIIDGADGDRLQLPNDEWDLYFDREFNNGPLRHEPEHYPDYQRQAKLLGKNPDRVYPLPFCIIPEKFSENKEPHNYTRDVFFKGIDSKQRTKYLEGINIPNSLIDIHSHTPIHLQNREEFFNLIRTSKINLNISGGGLDCMRFWELLGAGGFVLTERHNQVIEPPFIDGIHLDRFSSKEEMLDKITYYLKHSEIRETIRQASYKFAMENHTCFNRLEYIISKLKENGWTI